MVESIAIVVLVLLVAIGSVIGLWILALTIKGFMGLKNSSPTQIQEKKSKVSWNKIIKIILIILLVSVVLYALYKATEKFSSSDISINFEQAKIYDRISESEDYFINIYQKIGEAVGIEQFDIIIGFILFLIVTWIIGAVYTILTRKDSSERVLKLGTSGVIITLVVLLILFVVLVNSTSSKVEPKKEAVVDMTIVREGNYIDVPLKVVSIISVKIDTTNPRIERERGKSFWVCPEVIRPESGSHAEAYFKIITGQRTTTNIYQMTDQSKSALVSMGIDTVVVRFTKKLSNPDNNPCRFLN